MFIFINPVGKETKSNNILPTGTFHPPHFFCLSGRQERGKTSRNCSQSALEDSEIIWQKTRRRTTTATKRDGRLDLGGWAMKMAPETHFPLPPPPPLLSITCLLVPPSPANNPAHR